MARNLSTEQAQRGKAHAVLGAPACPGRSLYELTPACRRIAEDGGPGMSW
jgi:hypothetical protein